MASTIVVSWSEIDCACGCGEKTRGGTFKQGHNRRVSTSPGGTPQQLLSRAYTRRKQAMLKARETLGGKCARCGITNPLEWDHIEDDGYLDSRKSAGGYRRRPGLSTLYGEFNNIIRTGQSAKLQLLCPNCNQLKKIDRAEYSKPPTYGMI